jgi:hypothetical protein
VSRQTLIHLASYKKILFPFILFIVAIIAGLPSLKYDFFADDSILIIENPDIRSLEGVVSLYTKDFFAKPLVGVQVKSEIGYYRPVTKTTFALDWKIWERNPLGYHLTNVLIHALICLLIFLLMLRLGIPETSSFFLSLVFAVFPTHDQAISLINARSDLLCVLGILLACLGAVDKKIGWVIVGTLLAPFSKEQGVFIPFFIFFFLWLNGDWKNQRKYLDTSIYILVVYFALRWVALHDSSIPESSITQIFDLKHFILIGKLLEVLTFSMFGFGISHLSLLLIPQSAMNAGVILGWLFLILSMYGFVYSFLKNKIFTFGWLWIGLGFIPILMAHRLSMPLSDSVVPMMERWAYLPGIGLFFLVGLLLKNIKLEKKHWIVAGCTLPVLMGSLWMRMSTYANEKSFNQHSLLIYQQKDFQSLPKVLQIRRLDMEAILFAQRGELQSALQTYQRALEIDPEDVLILSNTGVIYSKLGDTKKAIELIQKALAPKKIYQEGDQVRY